MDLSKYQKDESTYEGTCEKAIIIESIEDIIQAVQNEKYITCQGARTGLTGAGLPTKGCVLDFEKWAGKTKEKEERGDHLTFASGTTLADIQKEVHKTMPDCFFAPDPTEETATIGGMFSTNAKGPLCYKYGATSDHIEAVKVITAKGQTLDISRNITEKALEKALPGRDFIQLLSGKEGELFVIAECTIRVLPKPKYQWHLFLFFETENMAEGFLKDLLQQEDNGTIVSLAGVDYIDSGSLKTMREYLGIQDQKSMGFTLPEEARGAVYLILHDDNDPEGDLETILMLTEKYAASHEDWVWAADTEYEIDRFKQYRHLLQEAINFKIRTIFHRIGYNGLTAIDLTGDHVSAEDIIRIVRNTIDGTIPFALCSHFGNKEVTVFFLPENEKEADILNEKLGEWVQQFRKAQIIAANGFGIGKQGGNYIRALSKEETVSEKQFLKKYFDPQNKFNVGNSF